MPQLKLSYFDFHGGRAEPIRLALAISAAGCAAVCVALIVNLLRGGVREPAEY